MLLSTVLLLFGGTLASNHFEFDGHFTAITIDDVKQAPTNRAVFLPAEERLRQRLYRLFEEKIDNFYVHSFAIHGEDLHPSAIFTAFISSPLSRSDLIHLISSETDLDVFRVKQLSFLPPAPEFDQNSTSVSFCLNGGFLLPNNSCSCPPFFTGYSCETINCLNGGIVDNGGCACPPGTNGAHCEPRGCLPLAIGSTDYHRISFILVVNQKSSMAYVLNELANLLGPQLGDMFADSIFQNYIIVNYVHTKNAVSIQKNAFTSYHQLVEYLNTLVYSVQGVDKQPNIRAVLAAQDFYPLMSLMSTVYVFTDSLDEDAGAADFTLAGNTIENQLILKSLAWRNTIIFYFSDSSKSFNYSVAGNGYNVFHRVAKATLGDVYTYQTTEIDTIIPNMFVYKYSRTLAAVYDVSNSGNVNLKTPVNENDGAVRILLTVPTGLLPKVTDQSRHEMKILANGTRWVLFDGGVTTTQVILHAGGQNVSLRAWTDAVESMLLTSSGNQHMDVGFPYLSATVVSLQLRSLESQNFETNAVNGNPVVSPCSYPFSFTNISACTPGPVGLYLIMTYNSGKTVDRLLPGYCLEMKKTLPTTATCFNGGTHFGIKSCKCTSQWEGPQCLTPVCQNGGKANPFPGNGFGLCICAPGFSGDFCDILNCTIPPSDPPISTLVSLVVILQSSLSQAQVGPSVDEGVLDLIKQMQGGDQYDQFILTTFVFEKQSVNVISTSNYTNSSAFQDALNNVKYLPTPSKTGEDPLAALAATFQNNSFFNSALFLLVDADPASTTNEPDIIMAAVERNVPINVILTPPFGMQQKCPSLRSQQFYQQLAIQTGGVFLNLCEALELTYVDPVKDLFSAYAVSHHRTEVINEIIFSAFVQKPKLFFSVDQPTSDVYLIVNCPTAEDFITKLQDIDLGTNPTLTPLYRIPFVGVYKVPTTAANKQGYQATVSPATSFSYHDSSCFIQAVIKSKSATYLRFSTNPSFDAQQISLEYAIPTNPVVHVDSLLFNRTYLPTLTATDDQNTVEYNTFPIVRTNSCSFEYWFEKKFICSRPSDSFTFRFSGMTIDGNEYMRSLRGYCYLQSGKCANGGYKLSTGICKCPPTYGGTYCQSPKCQNGFPVDQTDFECMCGEKYSGQFCETQVCDNWNYMESVDPRNNAPKQITFVLNSNADSLLVNVQLSNVIQTIVTTAGSQDMPILYTLLIYDQFSVTPIISTSHADQFVSGFQFAVNNYLQRATSPVTKSVDALVEAWKLSVKPPGIIFLFLGTPSAVPGVDSVDNFLEQKINTQVNVFYLPQKNGSYPILPYDQQTSILYQAAKQSGGRILALTQYSTSQLAPLITSAIQNKELLTDNGTSGCENGCDFSIIVETQFRTVEITITGVDVLVTGRVTVTQLDGTILPINSDTILFRDNQVLVLRYNSSMARGGTWYIRVSTPFGGSTIQARVDSDFRLYPGFTINSFDDFVHQIPFTGLGLNRSTYLTFRLVDSTNNLDNDATVDKIDAYRVYFPDSTIDSSHLRTLSVSKRDADTCAYQYVSQEWNVDIFTQQQFVITGKDGKGTSFIRIFNYQFPLYTQRQATCINGAHDQYGQCICTDKTKWTGDYCQTPICHNGGTESYGVCICANGYYGQFCDTNVIS